MTIPALIQFIVYNTIRIGQFVPDQRNYVRKHVHTRKKAEIDII